MFVVRTCWGQFAMRSRTKDVSWFVRFKLKFSSIWWHFRTLVHQTTMLTCSINIIYFKFSFFNQVFSFSRWVKVALRGEKFNINECYKLFIFIAIHIYYYLYLLLMLLAVFENTPVLFTVGPRYTGPILLNIHSFKAINTSVGHKNTHFDTSAHLRPLTGCGVCGGGRGSGVPSGSRKGSNQRDLQ